MGSALELEHRIGPLALDCEGHLLEAADLGRRLRDDLGPEAALLGVAGQHLEQVAGEEGRLVAPGPRPDLDEHVLGVVGVALDHRQTDLVAELLQPARRARRRAPCSSGSSPSSARSSLAPSRSSCSWTYRGPARAQARAPGTRGRAPRSARGRRSPPDRTSGARAPRSAPSIWLTSSESIPWS